MPLKKKQLEELKQMLLDERKKIIEHLYKLKNESELEISDIGGDNADIATLEISQKAFHKLGSRERKLLKKIDHALAKFENGTYGICELTGEEIPYERLKARPVAQYTVEAKEELERKERGFRDVSDFEDDSFDNDLD
ncbi:MAG: TraR/DksA family transcriptional regulator [Candidatus Dadabacteria bacterium]|nr:MAG: TraR/DksA family transcriptional regulator [Candidatus Dadabacteria bacterium]